MKRRLHYLGILLCLLGVVVFSTWFKPGYIEGATGSSGNTSNSTVNNAYKITSLIYNTSDLVNMLGYTYVDPNTKQTVTVQYGPGQPNKKVVLDANEYITCMYSNQPYRSKRGEWYAFVITNVATNTPRTVMVAGSATGIPAKYDDPSYYRSGGSTSHAWNIYHPQTHITDFIWSVNKSDPANTNANANANSNRGDSYINASLADIVNAPLPIKCKIIGLAYTIDGDSIAQIDCIYPGWRVRYGSPEYDPTPLRKTILFNFNSDEYLVSMQAVNGTTTPPLPPVVQQFYDRMNRRGMQSPPPSASKPNDNRLRGSAYAITLWSSNRGPRQINLSSKGYVTTPAAQNVPVSHIVKLNWDSDPASPTGRIIGTDTDKIPNRDTFLIDYLNTITTYKFNAHPENIGNIKDTLMRNNVNPDFYNNANPGLSRQFLTQMNKFIGSMTKDFDITESFQPIKEGNSSLYAYDTVVQNTVLDPSKIPEKDSIQALKNIDIHTVDDANKFKPYFQYVGIMSQFRIPYNKFDDFKSRVYLMKSNITPDDMTQKVNKLKSFGIPNYDKFLACYDIIVDTVGVNYNFMELIGNLNTFGMTNMSQLEDFLSQLKPIIHLNADHDFNAWIQLCSSQYGITYPNSIHIMTAFAKFNIMYNDMCKTPDFAYLLAFGINRAGDIYRDKSNVSLDTWLNAITLPDAQQIGAKITLQQYIGSYLSLNILVDKYRDYQALLAPYTTKTQDYFHVNLFLLSFDIKDWKTISSVIGILFGTLKIPVDQLQEFSQLMYRFMNLSVDSDNYQSSYDTPMIKLTTILAMLVQYNISYSPGSTNRLYNLFRFFSNTHVNYNQMHDLVQPLILKLYNYDNTLSDLATINRDTYLTNFKQSSSTLYDALQKQNPLTDKDALVRYINTDKDNLYEDAYFIIVLSFTPDDNFIALSGSQSATQSFSDNDYVDMLQRMNDYITTSIYHQSDSDVKQKTEIESLRDYVFCAEISRCFPVVTRISLQKYLQKWANTNDQKIVCDKKNPLNYRQTNYYLSEPSAIVENQKKTFLKICNPEKQ